MSSLYTSRVMVTMQHLNAGLCLHLQVNELHSKMSRFHGLTAANPERKTIASAVTDGCESMKWQVRCTFAKQLRVSAQALQAALLQSPLQQTAQLHLHDAYCKQTKRPMQHLDNMCALFVLDSKSTHQGSFFCT